jgi:hypothetical protein
VKILSTSNRLVFVLTLALVLVCQRELALAQAVPYHIENEQVYEFLEELASIKVIQLNSAVLPLTRKEIYQLLNEAGRDSTKLNSRQSNELAFYKQEFIKDGPDYRGTDYLFKGVKTGGMFPLRNRAKNYDLFHYKDSLFNITVNSRFGGEGWWTNGDVYYERVVGAQVYGNISEYFTFYADIRDYHSSDRLSDESYLNQRLGVNYKSNLDYSEMRGGIAASTKWGYLGIVKDHVKWGNSYNGSNIFSGRTPSFPMIKLHLNPVKWFSFDYIHAWLISDVIDSTASYATGSVTRDIMRPKFMAANMFTVRPIKGLHFSFGNSVVYSDKFNAVYLIPFLFYKSVDHTLNSTGSGNNSRGQNSQMFVNLVSRQIKYLQLYTSLFVDEIRLSTMFKPSKSRNHVSWKAGFRFTAPGKVNASLIFEYTRNQPFTYQHFVSTTTFESNSYALGHYLRTNAEEFHVALVYKPISRLRSKLGYTLVRKGKTLVYDSGADGEGGGLIENEIFRRHQITWEVSYQVAQNIKVGLNYQYLRETGSAAYTTLPTVISSGPHSMGLRLMVGI